MKTYPIKTITLEQAKEMQFRLVDKIHKYFRGDEILQNGDLGVVPGIGRPFYTSKVESVLADFFDAEDAMLVRGAGTGAIRSVMNEMLKPGQKLLVHDAPIYPTTKVIVESMGLKPIFLDYNKLDKNKGIDSEINFVIVQHSRQKIDDSYDLAEVIAKLKMLNKEIKILTDDNYVVMKADKIGAQCGADVSAFSLFKLLGPEGIGCIVGSKNIVDRVRKKNYSGGSQVQGFEAMEALRALVYSPVSLAIQGEVGDQVVSRINKNEVPGVKSAFIANAQSRVILVEFDKPIAKQVLKIAPDFGAAPYPVGAESKYEVSAMFYQVSGTFRQADPKLEEYMIRINPMRAGANTVINILKESVGQVSMKGGR